MNNDDTPIPTLDQRGAITLLRDSTRPTSAFDTGETCPACAGENGKPGDGIVRVDRPDGTYSTSTCTVCDGQSFLTPEQAAAYRRSKSERP